MTAIAFTGGGTAGHIFPGLAVAEELKKLLDSEGVKHRIFWIGSSAGEMDRGIVEKAGIEFFSVPSGKLRRYFSFKNAADFFRVIAGFFSARKILKKEKARIVFSKGGFVSVPPCAAAASLNIPVFTHESDFSPGLATRIVARFVARTNGKIFTSYNETAQFLPEKFRNLAIASGNPVRGVFRKADAQKGREFLKVDADAKILLVLGGSQGAREINELVKTALKDLILMYTVVHQTGPNNSWDLPVTDRYRHFPFIADELPHVMAASDLIAGRSGAGIWEWAVLGKPMILIPLAGSGTRGDQAQNADFFANAGAALALKGADVNPAAFADAVKSIAHNAEKRDAMADASKAVGSKDSARSIAGIIVNFIINNIRSKT